LAKFLNIVHSIQIAAPSDGLFGDDRTDEAQLGATYPELEWAMQATEQENDVSNYTEREKKVLGIYKKLNASNQHKMNPIPVCVIPTNLK